MPGIVSVWADRNGRALVWQRTGEGVRWQWALAPLTLALMACFTAGAAMLMARGTSIWRDLHNLLPYILRMWMYFAGGAFLVLAALWCIRNRRPLPARAT
jgi:ABC-type polysaccharide/polyol phosphate export permease